MNKFKVYLAGAMEAASAEEMRGWRQEWIEKYPEIEFLDPTSRKPFHDQPPTIELSRKIFDADKKDILDSDIVIFKLSTDKPQIGTMIELCLCLFDPKFFNKVIVVYENHHPFLDVMFTDYFVDDHRVFNMEEAYKIFDQWLSEVERTDAD